MPYERDFIAEDELLDTEGSAEFGNEEENEDPERDTDVDREEMTEGRERVHEGHGMLGVEDIRDLEGKVLSDDVSLVEALNGLKAEGGGELFVDTYTEDGIDFFHTYYTVDMDGNVSYFIDKESIAPSESEEAEDTIPDEHESGTNVFEIAPAYLEPQPETLPSEAFDTVANASEEAQISGHADVEPREQADTRPTLTEKDAFTNEITSEPIRQESRNEPVVSRERVEAAIEPVARAEAPASQPHRESRPEAAESEVRTEAPDEWLTRLLDLGQPSEEKIAIVDLDLIAPEPREESPTEAPEAHVSGSSEAPVRISSEQKTEEAYVPAHVSREEIPVSTESVMPAQPAIRLVRDVERSAPLMQRTREEQVPERPTLSREYPEPALQRSAQRESIERTAQKPKEKAVLDVEPRSEPETVAKGVTEALRQQDGIERNDRMASSARSVENSRPRGGFVNADEDNQTTRAPRIRLKRDGILMEIAA